MNASTVPETPVGGRGRWTARSVGAGWQHRFFYGLIRRGGRRAAYGFLRLVAAWYVLFRPAERRKTRPYLERRFPGRGPCGRLIDSYRMMVALGETLIDRAALGILGPSDFSVTHHNRDALQGLVAENKGLVLVTAHVGCWQVAMRSLDLLDRPVHMLMRREEGDVDRQWHEHAGVPRPYHSIDPDGYLGGVLEILGALRRGEVVCIMGDRVYGGDRHNLRARFLGEDAPFPVGPYQVAAAAGCPVAIVLSAKTGYRTYAMHLAAVLRPARAEGNSPESFRGPVDRFAAALEEYVREHPWQFFNFYDLWQ